MGKERQTEPLKSAAREKQINVEMSILDETLTRLADVVDRFEEALSPLMNSYPQPDDTIAQDAEAALCGFADNIRTSRRCFAKHVDRLEDFLERLEI